MTMPASRFAQFANNVGRARELVGLGQSLHTITQGAIESTDMYRAALVQAVAALDSYVHGVILDYGIDILMGRRSAGNGARTGLHFGAVSDLLSAPDRVEMELRARTHVAQRLALETFQKPDDIASAFAMVGIRKLWSTAFPSDTKGTTTALGLIVNRRNDIVHSCDADPLAPEQKRTLTDSDSLYSVNRIAHIIKSIDSVV